MKRVDRACVSKLLTAEWETDRAYELVSEECRDQGLILDVGCGCGVQYAAFKRYLAQVNYTGVDIDEPILAFSSRTFPDCTWKWADARALPFEDNEFGVVVLRHVLEHHPPNQMVVILSEAIRVASKKVVVLFFKAPKEERNLYTNRAGLCVNRFSRSEVLDVLDQAGGDLRRVRIPKTKKSCALTEQELWTQDIR